MFKDISEAYSVLSDPEKRKMVDLGAYDPSNPSGGGGFEGFSGGGMGGIDPNEIFKMFFGGGGGMGGGMGGSPFASGGMEDNIF